MIVEQKKREFEQSDAAAQSFNFGIDEEDMPHIASLLEDKVYRDKVLAVVREYSANAIDAHIEAGCPEKPIFVQLPTEFEPNFKVRDYGLGLSEEKLRTVFTRYGKSTKRTSNKMIGCLGLGCKAGFAYSNSFLVISIHGGRKFVYNGVKDNNGMNRLIKMSEEETTEPSGIEICIPVAEDDFSTFKNRALSLYRWFKVKPEVVGITAEEIAEISPERTVLLQGKDWVFYDEGGARAIMGNIGYEISAYDVNNASELVRKLLQSNIEMEFEIGELDIVMSREGLEYTEKTIKALTERVESILPSFQKLVQERFDQCATYWDAKAYYGEINERSTNTDVYKFRNFIDMKGFTWQGTPITSDAIEPSEKVTCMRVIQSKGRTKLTEREQLICRKNTLCVINDLGSFRGAKNRLTPEIAKVENEWTYLFTFDNQADWDAFVSENHLESVPFRKLSEYPYQKAVRIGSVNTKHVSKTFVLNEEHIDKKSDAWTPEEIDLNVGGIYVPLDRFEAMLFNNTVCANDIRKHLETLDKLGITIDTVYGFKVGYLEKHPLPANWISLDKYVQDQLAAEFAKQGLAQKWADYTAITEFCNISYFHCHFCDFAKLVEKELENQSGLAAQFAYAVKVMSEGEKEVEQYESLALAFKLSPTAATQPTFDINALYERLWKHYSMLELINDSYFRQYYKEHHPKIIEYINSIDKI